MTKTPYLDPTTRFAGKPDLRDVLVLVPSYKTPEIRTALLIRQLMECGASILNSNGCSDPALHRCLIAGRALKMLENEPVETKHSFVMWLDSDMVATPAHVAFMRSACIELEAPVVAAYCKRETPNIVCLREIHSQTIAPRTCAIEGFEPFEVKACVGGMGALMLPADQFVEHCRSVPCIEAPPGEMTYMTPGICASGMCDDARGVKGWVSEDIAYCQSLWHYGIGLWSLPIVFGHLSLVALYPSPEAHWLVEN